MKFQGPKSIKNQLLEKTEATDLFLLRGEILSIQFSDAKKANSFKGFIEVLLEGNAEVVGNKVKLDAQNSQLLLTEYELGTFNELKMEIEKSSPKLASRP